MKLISTTNFQVPNQEAEVLRDGVPTRRRVPQAGCHGVPEDARARSGRPRVRLQRAEIPPPGEQIVRRLPALGGGRERLRERRRGGRHGDEQAGQREEGEAGRIGGLPRQGGFDGAGQQN